MSSMNIALTKLCNRNGLPDIRWHDLRATYCTKPFIDEVFPEEEVIDLCDVDCMDLVALELIE